MKQEGSVALPSRHWQAAIILRARQEMAALNLPPDADMSDVLEATGSSRSRAYGLASELPEHLPNRRPGRPREEEKGPDVATLQRELEVTRLVRDYMAEHPGAMTKREERLQYSDGFRSFALDLVGPDGPAEGFTTAQVASALGISLHTLNSWLRTGPSKLQQAGGEVQPAAPVEESKASWSRDSERVLALWKVWKGNLAGFCDAVADKGIEMSRTRISQVLYAAGLRDRKPRRRHRIDGEAVRGAIERFFPNAQVATDGKYVDLTLDGERHRFCWQLVTDVTTGAYLGLDVRDQEDGIGFLNAYEQAKCTAGNTPVAALRDNRACNVSKAVEEGLARDNVLSMTSRKGRPQTNGMTEGAFGLFEQSMPDIALDSGNRRELARDIIRYVLTAFCSGRNQTPRQQLNSSSPVEAFSGQEASNDERAVTRQRLDALNKRARRTGKRRQRRQEQPAVRKLMLDLLVGIGVDQPRKGTIDKLASLGLDASVEAAGIVLAKLDNGLELGGDPERYLLKIAINLANRNEDIAAFAHTVKLREKAGEIIMQPLHDQNSHMKTSLSVAEYLAETANRALDADTRIDRYFWWQRTLDTLTTMTADTRAKHARHLARKVATRYALHYRERDTLIGQLAKVSTALPGGM
jgi:hypothetical protein